MSDVVTSYTFGKFSDNTKSNILRKDLVDVNGQLDLYKIEKLMRRGVRIQDMPLTVAFYARVSTDEEIQLHSLSSQIGYYENMIKSNPNWTFYDGYWDEGISGTSTKKRERFNDMISDGYDNRFDLIITKEISRFARNTVDSLEYTRELLRHKVGVFFESDNILTFEQDSEFRLTIMSSVAQEESRKTHERVKRGNRISISNHVVLGNNNFYGYTKDKGKLVVNEQEAVLIRKVFDLYANKYFGLRKIARILYEEGFRNYAGKRIAEKTLKGILSNPKYKGYYCGGKTTKMRHLDSTIIKIPEEQWVMFKDEKGDIVPAIVSEEIWEKANKILAKKHDVYTSQDRTISFNGGYIYSSKIMCEEHGAPYCRCAYRNKRKDGSVLEREVWQCATYIKQGAKACQMPKLYTDELNLVIMDLVRSLARDQDALNDRLTKLCIEASKQGNNDKLAEEIKAEIDVMKSRRDKLLDVLINGRITDAEFDIRNKEMTKQIEAKEGQLRLLEEQKQDALRLEDECDRLRAAILEIGKSENGFNRAIVDSIIDLIVVKKESGKRDVVLDIYVKYQEEGIRVGFSNRRAKYYKAESEDNMDSANDDMKTSVCRISDPLKSTNRSEDETKTSICGVSERW